MGSQLNVVFYPQNLIRLQNGELLGERSCFVKLVADELNATFNYIELEYDREKFEKGYTHFRPVVKLVRRDKLDFLVNGLSHYGNLESYDYYEYCFVAPLPPKYKIYEQVLVLPLDVSCWIGLGNLLNFREWFEKLLLYIFV